MKQLKEAVKLASLALLSSLFKKNRKNESESMLWWLPNSGVFRTHRICTISEWEF